MIISWINKKALYIYHLGREVLIILKESHNVKRESIVVKFLVLNLYKDLKKFEYIVNFQLCVYIFLAIMSK